MFVSGQVASNSGTSTSPQGGTLPAAPTVGNYLLFTVRGTSATVSALNGWTQALYRANAGGTASIIELYRKVVSGDTATPPDITLSASEFWIAEVAEYSGWEATAPLDQVIGNESSATVNSFPAGPTAATTTASQEAIGVWVTNQATTSPYTVDNGFDGPRLSTTRTAVAHKQLTTSGQTPSSTWTFAGLARRVVSGMFTWKVASTSTPATVVAPTTAATANAPAPVVTVPATITAPTAAATGAALAPVLAAGATVTAPAAGASGAAPAPQVGVPAAVTAPVALATASAPAPTVLIPVVVLAPPANATASARPPTLHIIVPEVPPTPDEVRPLPMSPGPGGVDYTNLSARGRVRSLRRR